MHARSVATYRSRRMYSSTAIAEADIDPADEQRARKAWHKIYIGILTRVEPHPDADDEVVVQVDAGDRCLTVVTGGLYVEVGRKVAVALPGARVVDVAADVPRTTKLKKRRIRGVLSEGMLCSAKELGLSDDHATIHVLPADAPVGALLAEWLRV
ncbi:MAG: phenylalanyl-tRNA synthetase beta chain [Thermomicrobiales bacterium]|nr:phenylalanyl-tRNA synthetase beta chain [Thermomicrobiales bacterium]